MYLSELSVASFTTWNSLPVDSLTSRIIPRKRGLGPNGHGVCLYVASLLVPYLILLNTGIYLTIVQKYIMNPVTNPLVNQNDLLLVRYTHDIIWALIDLFTAVGLVAFCCHLYYKHNNSVHDNRMANNPQSQPQEDTGKDTNNNVHVV